MNTRPARTRDNASAQELIDLFNSLSRPYGEGEIVRFNLAYQRLYPKLSSDEKRCAETLVDALLADLEREKPASGVFRCRMKHPDHL